MADTPDCQESARMLICHIPLSSLAGLGLLEGQRVWSNYQPVGHEGNVASCSEALSMVCVHGAQYVVGVCLLGDSPPTG